MVWTVGPRRKSVRLIYTPISISILLTRGNVSQPYLHKFAVVSRQVYTTVNMFPRWVLLLVTGGLGSLIISAFHRNEKKPAPVSNFAHISYSQRFTDISMIDRSQRNRSPQPNAQNSLSPNVPSPALLPRARLQLLPLLRRSNDKERRRLEMLEGEVENDRAC